MAQPIGTVTIQHAPSPTRHPKRALPGRWIDLARDGDTQGTYRSRSEAAMALALAMANHGWTHTDWHTEMTDPGNQLAAWALTRPDGTMRSRRDTARRLDHTWTKATKRVGEQPPARTRPDILARLAEIQTEADTWTWTGRNARRDHDTLTDLLGHATRHATLTPSISVRALCELGRRHGARSTHAALHSLAERGWIRIDKPTDRKLAARYHLLTPARQATGTPGNTVVSRLPREGCVPRLTARRDQALDGLALVLSPVAADLYAALDGSPVSARELGRRVGCSHPTVARWLPRLARLGLAERGGDGWFRGAGDVATVTGEAAGEARARRAARHAGDRARWEAARAHWAAQRDGVRQRHRVRRAAWREGHPAAPGRVLSDAESRRDWMAVADARRRAA